MESLVKVVVDGISGPLCEFKVDAPEHPVLRLGLLRLYISRKMNWPPIEQRLLMGTKVLYDDSVPVRDLIKDTPERGKSPTLRISMIRRDREEAILLRQISNTMAPLQLFLAAPADLRGRKDVAMMLVQTDGRLLQVLGDDMQRERDVAIAAVRQNGAALQGVWETFRDDDALVIEAVQQFHGAMEHASARLKRDKQFVLSAVARAGCCIAHVAPHLRRDKDIAAAAIESQSEAYFKVDPALRGDKEFVIAAIAKVDPDRRGIDGRAAVMREASVGLRDDQDGGLAIPKSSSAALEFAWANMGFTMTQEEQSAVPLHRHFCYRQRRYTGVDPSDMLAGAIDVDENPDYNDDHAEIAKEIDEIQVARHWVNQEGWDVASETRVLSKSTGKVIDLHLDWGAVQKTLADGLDVAEDPDTRYVDEATVLSEYPLDKLNHTQREFADRVLRWAGKVAEVYDKVGSDGRHRPVPVMRSFLRGTADSRKSTTLRTTVQHVRLLFMKRDVPAKVELTTYTGAATINIGFGVHTACSAGHVFPNAAWKSEKDGVYLRKLEDTWQDVLLLIIDEVAFIGTVLFARMHIRTMQDIRAYFNERDINNNQNAFGDISMILVGDPGQLEMIDDRSRCATEKLRQLWKRHRKGRFLLTLFKEAILLTPIHRSKEDGWWAESCRRLRDRTCTKEGDYDYWRQHDLDRGHLNAEQLAHFENEALWICDRCVDVGQRNGRKLAHMAEDQKEIIHQIKAQQGRRAKKMPSFAFGGLRGVVNLVRGCKAVLTRNVANKFGLANGSRGDFIGAVYGPGGVGTFPKALVCEFPDYRGPAFYDGEPKWVPISPMTTFKEGTRMTRTQFPLVAGFALTANKARGLTVKEGVVIHLVQCRDYRPVSKHGMPFVAFTRAETFSMTAFKNLPPWQDFVKGHKADMLYTRLTFTEWLQGLHTETPACHSSLTTREDENEVHEERREAQESPVKRQRKVGPLMPCPCCAALGREERLVC